MYFEREFDQNKVLALEHASKESQSDQMKTENSIDLSKYTPEALRRFRAFSNTRRALEYGIFAYLGQNKESFSFMRGQLYYLFLRAQTTPLSDIPIKSSYNNTQITEAKIETSVSAKKSYNRDFRVLQSYQLVKLNKLEAHDNQLQERTISFSLLGKLLKLSLQYPEMELIEVFTPGSTELTKVDGPTIRARILKALLVSKTPLTLTQLAQTVDIDIPKLFFHVSELSEDLEIITKDTQVKYRLEQENDIVVRKNTRNEVLKNAVMQLTMEANQKGEPERYFSLQEICNRMNSNRPGMNCTINDIDTTLNYWYSKEKHGITKTHQTKIYLTPEQKPFCEDIVEYIDGADNPTKEYIDDGTQKAIEVLNNPSLFTLLASRFRLTYENKHLLRENRVDGVLLEIFAKNQNIAAKQLRILFNERTGVKFTLGTITQHLRDLESRSGLIEAKKEGNHNIWRFTPWYQEFESKLHSFPQNLIILKEYQEYEAMPEKEKVKMWESYQLVCEFYGFVRERQFTQLEKKLKAVKIRYESEIARLNLKLAYKIAEKYPPTENLSRDDLDQIAVEGLMRAIPKYDVSRKNTFSTYATNWIKQSLLAAITEEGFIKLPKAVYWELNRYKKLKEKLAAETGNEPTAEIMAEQLGGERVVFLEEQSLRSMKKSLDEPKDSEANESVSLYETIAESDSARQDASPEVLKRVAQLLDTLSPREREVIERLFGLDVHPEEKLEEIAQDYDLTPERIRQIKNKAIRKLRTSEPLRSDPSSELQKSEDTE